MFIKMYIICTSILIIALAFINLHDDSNNKKEKCNISYVPLVSNNFVNFFPITNCDNK